MPSYDVLPVRHIIKMIMGDEFTAMESAKKLIATSPEFLPLFLSEIVSCKQCRPSGRLAAAYALGFIGHWTNALPLIRVLNDENESAKLRGHAAEALGNIGDKKAVKHLAKILVATHPTSVKVWCVYAMGEIGGKEALSALSALHARGASGRLLKELRQVLGRLSELRPR